MNKINKIVLFISVILIALAFVMLFIQIISRYVLQVPFLIGDEISRYSTVWIIFLCTGLAARHDMMIKMEVVFSFLSWADKRKKVFESIAAIITIIFFSCVFLYGIEMIKINYTQITPILRISMAIPYAALPVGSFLIIANTIASFLDMDIRIASKELSATANEEEA